MKEIKLMATILGILALYVAFYFALYWVTDFCLRHYLQCTMEAKELIKNYLDERAKEDELFAKAYAKEGKSIDECFDYIMGEARKKGTEVCMVSDDVFSLAVHYYDEDDIKINRVTGCSGVATSSTREVELTAEDEKTAREAAINRVAEEQYSLLKKRPQRAKKEADVQQMSLF